MSAGGVGADRGAVPGSVTATVAEGPAAGAGALGALVAPPSEPGELRMWLAVRTDVAMSKGKLAAQAGHAFQWHAVERVRAGDPLFDEYMAGSTSKVAVAARNEHALRRVVEEARKAGIPALMVTDEGRTELGGPTPTVAVFGPARREALPRYLSSLRRLLPGDVADPPGEH